MHRTLPLSAESKQPEFPTLPLEGDPTQVKLFLYCKQLATKFVSMTFHLFPSKTLPDYNTHIAADPFRPRDNQGSFEGFRVTERLHRRHGADVTTT